MAEDRLFPILDRNTPLIDRLRDGRGDPNISSVDNFAKELSGVLDEDDGVVEAFCKYVEAEISDETDDEELGSNIAHAIAAAAVDETDGVEESEDTDQEEESTSFSS